MSQHGKERDPYRISRFGMRKIESFTEILPGKLLFAAYVGPSMNPTLREPELMEILPYNGQRVKVGDVVLFRPPGGERSIVHRVVQVTTTGIRTRGDNSSRNDPYLSRPGDIVGRVSAAWRGRRRRRILGGKAGRWVSRSTRWRLALDHGACQLLAPLYHMLIRWGTARRWLPPRLRPRVVAFQVDGWRQLQLLLGGRVVGHYDAGRGAWRIQRPYRLLVDESALPGAGEHRS